MLFLTPLQHLLVISFALPGGAPRLPPPAEPLAWTQRKQKRPGDNRRRQGIVARSGSHPSGPLEMTKAGAPAPASWPIDLWDFFWVVFTTPPGSCQSRICPHVKGNRSAATGQRSDVVRGG